VLVPISMVDDLPLRQMGIDMTRRRHAPHHPAAAAGVTAAIGLARRLAPAGTGWGGQGGGIGGRGAAWRVATTCACQIRLRPTWLPDDVIELSREAWTTTGEQSRTWASPAGIAAQARR